MLHQLSRRARSPALGAWHGSRGIATTPAALSPARFRELLGQSPMAYVTRWRMDVARRLLRDGTPRLAEVCAAVGYDSLPAFSRVFKKLRGVPPSAIRPAA